MKEKELSKDSQSVSKDLIETNISTDRFFTTLLLAKLLSWNLSLVGILRKNKPNNSSGDEAIQIERTVDNVF